MAEIYDSLHWRTARAAALHRDRGKCQVRRLLGGDCSTVLHVHHVVRPEHGGDAYALDNLICVCENHHPQLEAIRRSVLNKRGWKSCRHEHRSAEARRLCERRMNRDLLATA